jgi:hypothetical protein
MLEEIWSVIESFDKKPDVVPQLPQQQQKRKLDEIEPENIEDKKRTKTIEEIPTQDERTKFDWLELIKNELNKKENHQISLLKLSKKVLLFFQFIFI